MGLKILHTSDWHLGAHLYNSTREDEHQKFLDWLLLTMKEGETDVLLVAGDVFHYAHPSAEALRLYYQFLARVEAETDVRQVVVVGGNHDSAARLDAPCEILEMLGVHMVGGMMRSRESLERCLCPIKNKEDGSIECVIASVPYVHEFHLGVRTTGRPLPEVKFDIEEAFRKLYTDLANLCEELYPDAPMIATGHLTCNGAQPGDYGTPIHMAALVGGLPPEIFDPRFAYVALGHIHRTFCVDQKRVWYSGSPVPLSSEESRYNQYILMLDVEGTCAEPTVAVEKKMIPRWRDLLELKGTCDELCNKIMSLQSECDYPPFLYVEVDVEHYTVDVARPLLEALKVHPSGKRPKILRVAQNLVEAELVEEEALPQTPLRDLDPEDVFVRLVKSKQQVEPREELLRAFRELVSDLK